jgi:hypothetical protein
LHRKSPGKRTKASVILLVVSAAIVLLEIIGPIFLSSGHDVISPRLHDQLQVLALISVPLIPLLLAIGAVLGILDWRTASKASKSPNLITVVAASLNLVLFLIGVVIVGYFLWAFEPYVGG